MDLVIGHPGSFAKEEAKGVELKREIILCLKSYEVSTMIYLNLHIPHASNSENMKAITSFMVSNSYFTLFNLYFCSLMDWVPGLDWTGDYSGKDKIGKISDSLFIQLH